MTMQANEPYTLRSWEFTAQVTVSGERPYSADNLVVVCERYAPFVLKSVARFEKFQRRYDESEGQDDAAAHEIEEHAARIWQAIQHGTRGLRGGLNHTEQEAQYRDTP